MFLFGLMDVPILCGLAWLGLDNRRDEAVLVFEIINNSTFEKTGPTTYNHRVFLRVWTFIGGSGTGLNQATQSSI